jgi:hypothetical protein
VDPDVDRYDWARLPHEIKWHADRAGVLLELLVPPGVTAERPDVDVTAEPAGPPGSEAADEMVIRHAATGDEICSVPMWRLERHDPALVREKIADLPDHAYDQALAANDAGQLEVVAPADGDFVFVFAAGKQFMAIHRSSVVPGWPAGAL